MDDRMNRYTGFLVGMWVFYNTIPKMLYVAVMLFEINYFNIQKHFKQLHISKQYLRLTQWPQK